MHNHPPGTPFAGPALGLLLADGEAILTGVSGRGGVGGDEKDLIPAPHVEREAPLLLGARIRVERLLHACVRGGRKGEGRGQGDGFMSTTDAARSTGGGGGGFRGPSRGPAVDAGPLSPHVRTGAVAPPPSRGPRDATGVVASRRLLARHTESPDLARRANVNVAAGSN